MSFHRTGIEGEVKTNNITALLYSEELVESGKASETSWLKSVGSPTSAAPVHVNISTDTKHRAEQLFKS